MTFEKNRCEHCTLWNPLNGKISPISQTYQVSPSPVVPILTRKVSAPSKTWTIDPGNNADGDKTEVGQRVTGEQYRSPKLSRYEDSRKRVQSTKRQQRHRSASVSGNYLMRQRWSTNSGKINPDQLDMISNLSQSNKVRHSLSPISQRWIRRKNGTRIKRWIFPETEWLGKWKSFMPLNRFWLLFLQS